MRGWIIKNQAKKFVQLLLNNRCSSRDSLTECSENFYYPHPFHVTLVEDYTFTDNLSNENINNHFTAIFFSGDFWSPVEQKFWQLKKVSSTETLSVHFINIPSVMEVLSLNCWLDVRIYEAKWSYLDSHFNLSHWSQLEERETQVWILIDIDHAERVF